MPFDLVVGADGVNSILREAMLKAVPSFEGEWPACFQLQNMHEKIDTFSYRRRRLDDRI